MSLLSTISNWFPKKDTQQWGGIDPSYRQTIGGVVYNGAGDVVPTTFKPFTPPTQQWDSSGTLTNIPVAKPVTYKPFTGGTQQWDSSGVLTKVPGASATDSSFMQPPATSGQPASASTTYNDPSGSATNSSFMQAPATSGQGGYGATTTQNSGQGGQVSSPSGQGGPVNPSAAPTKPLPPPPLTVGESLALAKSYGLEGMGQNFAGMTAEAANIKAKEAKDRFSRQTSALTSGTFNPQTIAGVNKTMEDFKKRIDAITLDPFNKHLKESNTKDAVNVFSGEIAKNFASLNDFQNAQQSPDFAKSLEPFLKAGGTLADIASKITPDVQDIQPPTDTTSFLTNQQNLQNQPVPIKEINNPDGTTTTIFNNGLTDTTDANGNPVSNQEAYDKILPETLAGQNRIAKLAGIPEELNSLYFGTPEKMGLYQQEIDLEKEKVKNLEKKAADAKATAREKAQYSIDKNRSDISTAKATNELNRLNSKNYMTGMLAKLGALMTTGAAPLALATLEEKYQRSAQELDTKLSFANREIEIGLTETLNEIENNLADKEYAVREDLSKSGREMQKEIFDAQKKAQREIYTISSKSDKDFRTAMDSYKKDSASNQAKYATTYMSLAGKGFSQAQILQILTSTGIVDVTKLTPAMQKLLAPKAPKGTAVGQAKALKNDIADGILTFRKIMKTNKWAGVNPEHYQGFADTLQAEYGASAVLEFEKAMSEAGLSVDIQS